MQMMWHLQVLVVQLDDGLHVLLLVGIAAVFGGFACTVRQTTGCSKGLDA